MTDDRDPLAERPAREAGLHPGYEAAPEAEIAPEPTVEPRKPEEPERESTGGVLGVGMGLLLLFVPLALLALMAMAPLLATLFEDLLPKEADEAQRVAELFRDAAPPFELEVVEARQLKSGEKILRLAREASEAEDAPESPAASGPDELVLIEFKSAAGVTELFGGSSGGMHDRGDGDEGGQFHGASATLLAWEKDPKFAWHTTIERDDIDWSTWKADMVLERAFHEGGGWRDSARVNLTQAERRLVLFAQWPAETEAKKDELRSVLRSIRMLETEES